MAKATDMVTAAPPGVAHQRQPDLRKLQAALAALCLWAVSQAAVLLPSNVQADAQTESSQSAPAESEPALTPAQLIESMSHSLRTLNYEGVFVHARGTTLNTLEIAHASNARGEFERLLSLDGEAREIIRNNDMVTCIWPGTESVIVSKSKPRDLLPHIDASLATSEHYMSTLGPLDRVAGRQTHVVNVIPRDNYRYGYRFWIDTENNMLLRSMLLEGPDKLIEQIVFTDISFPQSIDASRFSIMDSDDQSDRLSWLEPKKTQANATIDAHPKEQSDRVGFSALPGGYRKVSETYTPSMPTKQGPVSHVMLSDGMASVSVYVEYIDGEASVERTIGLSRMGAMNAYGVRSEEALITAVGEVPEATVKAIAASVVFNE